MPTLFRESRDILSQLYRLDYGWRTFGNVLKQLFAYIRPR